MKFETVRIYSLSEFSVCCHPKILLPWQRDVTTFSLYHSPLSALMGVCIKRVEFRETVRAFFPQGQIKENYP